MEIWQKFIAWERSNPLRIEDQMLLNKRVMFAFEQCLLNLGHFPNIWQQAASHLQECSRTLSEKGDVDNSKTINDQVVVLYEKAIANLHAKNLILYLAFADFEEQQMRTQNAHEIYKKFLAQEDVDPTLVKQKNHPRKVQKKSNFFSIFDTVLHPLYAILSPK